MTVSGTTQLIMCPDRLYQQDRSSSSALLAASHHGCRIRSYYISSSYTRPTRFLILTGNLLQETFLLLYKGSASYAFLN